MSVAETDPGTRTIQSLTRPGTTLLVVSSRSSFWEASLASAEAAGEPASDGNTSGALRSLPFARTNANVRPDTQLVPDSRDQPSDETGVLLPSVLLPSSKLDCSFVLLVVAQGSGDRIGRGCRQSRVRREHLRRALVIADCSPTVLAPRIDRGERSMNVLPDSRCEGQICADRASNMCPGDLHGAER